MTVKDKIRQFDTDRIDYAFQPVVNVHTGACHGYEALLRNYEKAGFLSISEFFNRAFDNQVLHPVDLVLREKAIAKFKKIPWSDRVRLFFNLDNRVLESETYHEGSTLAILHRYGLSRSTICFEISEKHGLGETCKTLGTLEAYRSQGFKIAVDDYGTGFSGLRMLYYTEPDFIKIDRFFVQDLLDDLKKRLLVSSIVNIAHTMGSLVIAEGVENEREYFACKNIGCDLIQGYLVQAPVTDIGLLKERYPHISCLNRADRRGFRAGDRHLIHTEITYIDPLPYTSEIIEVFQKFKTRNGTSFFPIVNENCEPLGVIRENTFKKYTYSRFGLELLQNPAFGKNILKFASKFPIADIRAPVEKILETFSQNENMEGIIIVDGVKYIGVLSAHSLLKVLNEKNLAVARDQNPLTRLPGNSRIHEYVSTALQNTDKQFILVYFDFDHFKPFNDRYGFRVGDRIILRFSELLKNLGQKPGYFIGHIGGDDFFLGIEGVPIETAIEEVCDIVNRFQGEAKSFHDPESIERGYLLSKDREGNRRAFPLLTVSGVVLELPAKNRAIYTSDEISNLIAENKHLAKNSPDKLTSVILGDEQPPFALEPETSDFSTSTQLFHRWFAASR